MIFTEQEREKLKQVRESADEFFVYKSDKKDPAYFDSAGVMSVVGGKLLVFTSKRPTSDKYSRKLVWHGRAKAQHGLTAALVALRLAAKAMVK